MSLQTSSLDRDLCLERFFFISTCRGIMHVDRLRKSDLRSAYIHLSLNRCMFATAKLKVLKTLIDRGFGLWHILVLFDPALSLFVGFFDERWDKH